MGTPGTLYLFCSMAGKNIFAPPVDEVDKSQESSGALELRVNNPHKRTNKTKRTICFFTQESTLSKREVAPRTRLTKLRQGNIFLKVSFETGTVDIACFASLTAARYLRWYCTGSTAAHSRRNTSRRWPAPASAGCTSGTHLRRGSKTEEVEALL